VALYLFSGTAEPNPLFELIWTFEKISNLFQEPFSGIMTRQLWSSEMAPFLRGLMRSIASLG
jgi:hypothetical protein